MTQEYAISQYHDTNKVYEQLNHLISQPIRHVRREKMQEFLGYFEKQCKRSKELTDEAKRVVDVVRACQDAGLLHSSSAELMAVAVWGQLHGIISLAFEGQIPHEILDGQGLEDVVLFAIEQILTA